MKGVSFLALYPAMYYILADTGAINEISSSFNGTYL